MSEEKLPIIPSASDDEFSEEERHHFCVKGIETAPQLGIQILENRKTGTSRYWMVTTLASRIMEWKTEEEKEV